MQGLFSQIGGENDAKVLGLLEGRHWVENGDQAVNRIENNLPRMGTILMTVRWLISFLQRSTPASMTSQR